MNKLKNGAILFLFIIGASLISYEKPASRFNSEDKLLVSFIVLGAFLLSLTFSFLLAKSEKRIKENRHTYTWLIVSSVIVSILIYIIVVIFSIYYSSYFLHLQTDSSGMFGFAVLAVGLLVVPLAVLIFNLIPLLVFYKFNSKKTFLKVVQLVFILVSFTLITYFIVRVITCDFNRDYGCVAVKAVEAGNPQLCERVRQEFRKGLCYYKVSQKISDLSLCDHILDGAMKDLCVREIVNKR